MVRKERDGGKTPRVMSSLAAVPRWIELTQMLLCVDNSALPEKRIGKAKVSHANDLRLPGFVFLGLSK